MHQWGRCAPLGYIHTAGKIRFIAMMCLSFFLNAWTAQISWNLIFSRDSSHIHSQIKDWVFVTQPPSEWLNWNSWHFLSLMMDKYSSVLCLLKKINLALFIIANILFPNVPSFIHQLKNETKSLTFMHTSINSVSQLTSSENKPKCNRSEQ